MNDYIFADIDSLHRRRDLGSDPVQDPQVVVPLPLPEKGGGIGWGMVVGMIMLSSLFMYLHFYFNQGEIYVMTDFSSMLKAGRAQGDKLWEEKREAHLMNLLRAQSLWGSGYTFDADATAIATEPTTPQEVATIEQVHEEVLAEAEKSLELVKSFLKEVNEEETGEINALQDMGFGGSKTVKHKELVASRREVAEWLDLFPSLKYIRREEMERIAEKYSLVIASPVHFTGPIPKENRTALAEFYQEHGDDPTMVVAGTVDQFSIKGLIKRGPYLVEDPDPIVLWKLNADDWFIVTMWGPEAEIEELQ